MKAGRCNVGVGLPVMAGFMPDGLRLICPRAALACGGWLALRRRSNGGSPS